MTDRPRIILDCDPGVDDAIAIITAARWTDLVAMTTVSGNVDLDKTTANALRMRDLMGLDVPVHRGAARPFAGEPFHARYVHGMSGLGDIDLPPPSVPPDSDDAVEVIVETTRKEEGLHLVPIGPLTNIALALRADPGIAQRVASITIMGGGASGGNVTAAAEFNIYVDPEAADEVFRAGAPLTMVGLNLTHQVRMDAGHADACRGFGHRVGDIAAQLIDHNVDVHALGGLPGSGAMHDPCAVLAVSHPEVIRSEHRHVVVEVEGRYTRGQTLVDERGRMSRDPNCRVAYEADADRALELILQAVREAPNT
ncbi:MAG: nucleoside hydrolase [Acidimicrobiales bacterium]|nr:nucleoside hydrolase [Acidimicrobiales bacterium]